MVMLVDSFIALIELAKRNSMAGPDASYRQPDAGCGLTLSIARINMEAVGDGGGGLGGSRSLIEGQFQRTLRGMDTISMNKFFLVLLQELFNSNKIPRLSV
jgi:hypothetical protein